MYFCVPKGSVLGPLLFILYFNDMLKPLSYCKSIFANDTTMYLTGYNLKVLYEQVNSDLKSHWLLQGEPTLCKSNWDKYILFSKTWYIKLMGCFFKLIMRSKSIPLNFMEWSLIRIWRWNSMLRIVNLKYLEEYMHYTYPRMSCNNHISKFKISVLYIRIWHMDWFIYMGKYITQIY